MDAAFRVLTAEENEHHITTVMNAERKASCMSMIPEISYVNTAF